MTLLRVRDLRVHFRRPASALGRLLGQQDQVVRAVDGVFLDVRRGETLGLVGESGCGKTTLGRAVLGLVPFTSGEVWFDGVNVGSLRSQQPFRRRAQLVFQNPYASLNPRKTVGQILGLAIHLREAATTRAAGQDPDAEAAASIGDRPRHLPTGWRALRLRRQREIARLLELVGLSAASISRYPHQFSGGQRQRIAIARALAMRPEFLVLDEPVSALDVSVQAQILNLLDDLKRELNLTYLFISHDLAVVRQVSDRVAVMYLGQIVETQPAESLFSDPLHPYTRALRSAAPQPSRALRQERILLAGSPPSPSHPPGGCRFHPRCPMAGPILARCQREVPPLREVAQGRVVACHLFDPGAANTVGPSSGFRRDETSAG